MSLVQVHAVEIKSRPDLVLFVRVLDALEELDLRDALIKENEVRRLMAAQLSAYLCDKDGNRLLTDIDAVFVWIRDNRVRGTVCAKIVQAGERHNELSDESLEIAEKN